jgi:hypothetical protein
MADTGSAGKVDRTASNPPPQEPTVSSPSESANATVRVRPQWPITRFLVEDVPEITDSGTMLTKPQLKAAQAAADSSGVRLDIEEGN